MSLVTDTEPDKEQRWENLQTFLRTDWGLIEEPQFSALNHYNTTHNKLQQNNIGFFHTLLLKNNFSYQTYGWDGSTKTLSLLGPHDKQSALEKIPLNRTERNYSLWTGLEVTAPSGQHWKKCSFSTALKSITGLDCTANITTK